MLAQGAAATAKRNDMKYRIVGADGKTYGPVGLEQVRWWIVEGRAESRTPVFVEGASDWTFLGLLPELAADFAASPPTIAAAKPLAPSSRGTNAFAVAGLICSLLSWTGCFCCCCLPFNLLGVVFSLIALAQISSQPEPQEGRVLAIIGLVLSVANLLFLFGGALLQAAFGNNTISWNFQ
jgi:hypothetical protein